MNYSRLKYFASVAGAVVCLAFSSFALTQSVDDVMEADQAKTEDAVESQDRVDDIADETNQITQEYNNVLKQIENLRVYNAQLELQIEDQEEQLSDLAQSIDEATRMEVNLVPLQLQMVDALDQFVEMDMPFNKEERRDRVERLRENMDRSDLSTAEKFRQILEAYSIEIDYGKNLETYTDTVNVDGDELEVDVLRVGRIALLYQTKDQEITGAWNPNVGEWVQLPAGKYRSEVAQGIRIARQQAAIDMLSLPITAPQG